MPRPRSEAIIQVKEKLIARLQDGYHPPGKRFFSNRGLAQQFGVSYQTAHRLIRELEEEGLLERRAASGTFVAGPSRQLKGVNLIFHERARREGSFGGRLLDHLSRALTSAGIDMKVSWSRGGEAPAHDDLRLPVLWECDAALAAFAESRRFLVVLNDSPPPGLASGFIDSVATDDFSGGAAAAELLRKIGPPRRLAALAGPKTDRRSRLRVEGFHYHAPKADVFWAESWFGEGARRLAPRIAERNYAGVFCCNDRLAEALLSTGTTSAVIGFDDAPVAERLNLTTIAIPWKEFVDGAVDIVRRRLGGDTGVAARLIFAPRPVIRSAFRM